MKIKLRIRTPKGQASKTEARIKPFILGRSWIKGKDKKYVTYTSPEDNEIIWDIEAPIKECMRIQRNVTVFDSLIAGVLDNPLLKRAIRKKLEPGQEEELKDMLINQTSCEVIKEATLQETVEYNKTFWEKIKETFSKKEQN